MRASTTDDNARQRRALSVFRQWLESAVVVAGRNARDVRAIKSNIGQFPIAELGQFGDIALIVAERLDHSNKREQHGSLLEFKIQLLKGTESSRVHIDAHTAVQKLKCCVAANLPVHS